MSGTFHFVNDRVQHEHGQEDYQRSPKGQSQASKFPKL